MRTPQNYEELETALSFAVLGVVVVLVIVLWWLFG